jgi:hypothetical protein
MILASKVDASSDVHVTARRYTATMTWQKGYGHYCPVAKAAEILLTVSADLRTMTRVWMGDLAIADALRMGALTLKGPPALRLSFPDWIGLSMFAHMQASAHASTVPEPVRKLERRRRAMPQQTALS